MAQSAKSEDGSLERQLQLKSPANKVYDLYRNKCDQFPAIMPEHIQSVEKTSPEVWLWTFVHDKYGCWKDVVESIHEETKSITWTLIAGEVPKKFFKSLKVVYQFCPNDHGCMAKAVLIFEKNNVNVSDPNDYADFLVKMFEAADEYLQKY